jgi:hypothetical protein
VAEAHDRRAERRERGVHLDAVGAADVPADGGRRDLAGGRRDVRGERRAPHGRGDRRRRVVHRVVGGVAGPDTQHGGHGDDGVRQEPTGHPEPHA